MINEKSSIPVQSFFIITCKEIGMAYTYLVGWKKLDLWYYGVRWAKGCDPSDLWKTYFTSSKTVNELRTLHGEPDVVEVRRSFDDTSAARAWEERVIDRMGCVNSQRWLNRHNKGRTFAQVGPRSETHRERLRQANTGKKYGPPTEEHLEKLRIAARAKWKDPTMVAKITAAREAVVQSPAHREKCRSIQAAISADPIKSAARSSKISAANKGKTLSIEHRFKISAAVKGKTGREWTEEQRKAVSEKRKGVPRTEEFKEKLRLSWAKRKEVA